LKQLLALLLTLTYATSLTAAPEVKPPKRVIHIHDVITGMTILDQTDKLWMLSKVSKKPVKIVINSPGGSIYAGLQFINAMTAAQKRGVKLHCYVSGIAMSMAFQILTHCDRRYAMEYSLVLWHPPRIGGVKYLTPQQAEVARRELMALEKDLVPQIIKTLNLPKRFVMMHYYDETIWTATRLRRVSPGFLRIVDDIPGVASVWRPDWSAIRECIDYCTPLDWRIIRDGGYGAE
jgi:ATP-dependent protease ClpP protease subunit